MINNPFLYRELDALPTLIVSQADDLKIDTRELTRTIDLPAGVQAILVWTSRVEPGTIEAERIIDGKAVKSRHEGDDIDFVVSAARAAGLFG